jgi:hypothetical protein
MHVVMRLDISTRAPAHTERAFAWRRSLLVLPWEEIYASVYARSLPNKTRRYRKRYDCLCNTFFTLSVSFGTSTWMRHLMLWGKTKPAIALLLSL